MKEKEIYIYGGRGMKSICGWGGGLSEKMKGRREGCEVIFQNYLLTFFIMRIVWCRFREGGEVGDKLINSLV